MSELKSSDYEAGWRLRLTFGDGSDASGVYDGECVSVFGSTVIYLAWRLGEWPGVHPHDRERITDITVLDRPSPFPMGTRVTHVDGWVGTVVAWDYPWLRVQRDGTGYVDGYVPKSLTVAPEQLTVKVGSWWRNTANGCSHVVHDVKDGVARLRSINAYGDLRPVPVDYLRRRYEPLDGPPEPPVGAVYVIGPDLWHNHNGAHLSTTPSLSGGDEWWHVKTIYSHEGLATLRILGTVGGAR